MWCGYFKLLVAFNVCTVTFLNIKSFMNSYSRKFYWNIPGVPIKAEFIEQNRTRRTKSQLTMMFKIQVLHGLVDIPADDYLTPALTRTRALYTKKLRQYASSTDALKYSFFPRTITIWNSLSANAPDLVSFKRELFKSSF